MSGQAQGGGRIKYDRKAKAAPKKDDNEASDEDMQDILEEPKKILKKDNISIPAIPFDQLRPNVVASIPVDIWLMIAEHTHPYSLLQLSRTNKFFHQILTSKELSKGVWRQTIRSLKNFPKLENDEIYGPAFVGMAFEDICSVCFREGEAAEELCHVWKRRWHGKCGQRIMMQGSDLQLKIPLMRNETLDCLPQVSIPNLGWNDHQRRRFSLFFVDEARYLNFELLDYLKYHTDADEAAALRAFVSTRKVRVEQMERDDVALQKWGQAFARQGINRFKDTLFAHYGADQQVTSTSNFQTIAKNWSWTLGSQLITEQGWNTFYRRMEKKFLLNSVSQSSQALYPGLRRKLDTKYRSFVKGKTASLPFPIFIDLPSIRKFWRPVGASRSAINRNWPEETVSVVQTEIQKASHWVELSYARNLAQALRRLQKPLAPSVYSSLNPENALLPPSTYTGIEDPLSTSGLLFDDPATISQQQLNDLLDQFSHQAWHFDSEIPQSFISVQINNFERLNEFEYQGPLFPHFNTFWHQILLQILDKTGVQDGPSKATTTILKGLKTTFACGVCSVTEKKTAKKNFVNLLKHFFDHHEFDAAGTPVESLVEYCPPTAVAGKR